MSEVAETTATDSGTTTEVVAPVVEAQPSTVAPTESLSPKERARARGRALDQARAETARKAEQAQQQYREGGKFAKQETDAASAASVSESEPPKAEGATVKPDGGPAEGFERIMYPEGHPQRVAEGVEYVDVPIASARHVKALLNGTYHRRQEVEAATQRALELEDRLARMEAETRFRSEHGHEFWTAEDQQFYEDVKNTYGDEKAELYRKSKIMEAENALRQTAETAQLEAVAGRVAAQGSEFKADALTGLPRMYPGLTTSEVETAIAMYAHELDKVQERALQRGMTPVQFFSKFGGYNEQDFFAVTKDYLETRPGVIARRRESGQASEVERNRIKAEVEAQQRREMQAASQRHAQNPNRNLGGGSVGPTTTSEPEPASMVGKSMSEIKRTGKQRFLDRFRQSQGG